MAVLVYFLKFFALGLFVPSSREEQIGHFQIYDCGLYFHLLLQDIEVKQILAGLDWLDLEASRSDLLWKGKWQRL